MKGDIEMNNLMVRFVELEDYDEFEIELNVNTKRWRMGRRI